MQLKCPSYLNRTSGNTESAENIMFWFEQNGIFRIWTKIKLTKQVFLNPTQYFFYANLRLNIFLDSRIIAKFHFCQTNLLSKKLLK